MGVGVVEESFHVESPPLARESSDSDSNGDRVCYEAIGCDGACYMRATC